MKQPGDIDAFHVLLLPAEFLCDRYGIACHAVGVVLGVAVLGVDGGSKCLYRVMIDPVHVPVEPPVFRGFPCKLQEKLRMMQRDRHLMRNHRKNVLFPLAERRVSEFPAQKNDADKFPFSEQWNENPYFKPGEQISMNLEKRSLCCVFHIVGGIHRERLYVAGPYAQT